MIVQLANTIDNHRQTVQISHHEYSTCHKMSCLFCARPSVMNCGNRYILHIPIHRFMQTIVYYTRYVCEVHASIIWVLQIFPKKTSQYAFCVDFDIEATFVKLTRWSENSYERWTFPHDLCLMLEVSREEMFNVPKCFLTWDSCIHWTSPFAKVRVAMQFVEKAKSSSTANCTFDSTQSLSNSARLWRISELHLNLMDVLHILLQTVFLCHIVLSADNPEVGVPNPQSPSRQCPRMLPETQELLAPENAELDARDLAPYHWLIYHRTCSQKSGSLSATEGSGSWVRFRSSTNGVPMIRLFWIGRDSNHSDRLLRRSSSSKDTRPSNPSVAFPMFTLMSKRRKASMHSQRCTK